MSKNCNAGKFTLIAGPCVLEDERTALRIGRAVHKICAELGWRYIFKASYDKANRTSIKSGRGPGLDRGLALLAEIRAKLGVPVLTDVHSPEEVCRAARCVDMLQIPAFLCRQTDLLVAAGESGVPVNVKKGQFLAPEDVDTIAEKLTVSGCQDYCITERGTSFGYHNLVVDMRGLATMRARGHRVIFDATHSVQRPGSLGGATGGDGKLAPVLARAAVAAGVDGLFIETHPDPAKSPSDGPNMIPLAQLPGILRQLDRIHEAL
ncbi:MAG: 3-deoxy-8-phosphooctulonate synthase [Verrucomicrobiales bacterium]|jgi:2-dehydro-3-deoxyphosphooctonate aldolase (KDO 8-P synthase)|nr:3-deoxy-8-phosphooctulonate synthase [Verrucomicrobiales bacterium]